MTFAPLQKAENPDQRAAASPSTEPTSTEAIILPVTSLRLSQRELQRTIQDMAPDQEVGFKPPHGCTPPEHQAWSARITEVSDSLSITSRDIEPSDLIPGGPFERDENNPWRGSTAPVTAALDDLGFIDWEDPDEFLTRDDIAIRLIKLRPTAETQASLNLTDADAVLFQKPPSAVRDTEGLQTDKARQREIVARLDTELKQPEFLDIRSLSRPPRILAYKGVDLSPLKDHVAELVAKQGNFILSFEDYFALSRIDGNYKILRNFSSADANPEAFSTFIDSLAPHCWTYLPEERPSVADLMAHLRIAFREEGTYYLKSARTSGGQGILRISHCDGDLSIETESPDAVTTLQDLTEMYCSCSQMWGEPAYREPATRSREGFQDPALYILARYIERMDCPIIEREVPGERVFAGRERAEFRLIFQDEKLAGMYTKVSPSDIAANISLSGRGVAVPEVLADIFARRLLGGSPEEIQSATEHAVGRLQEVSTKFAHQLIEHFKPEGRILDDFAVDLIPVWNEETQDLDLYLLEVQYGYGYSGLASVDSVAAFDVWQYKCGKALTQGNINLLGQLIANAPSSV